MTTSPPRPIGYWLKHLDALIEDHFAQALAADGVDRRQWQLLNTLAAEPADRPHLEMALAPFLIDDPTAAARALAALIERGWAQDHDGRITMTPDGAVVHRRLEGRVTASRARILDGITAEQYQAVLATLQLMAANLTGADHPQWPAGT
ncbi:MAG: MarR family transcriptional regulator [Actinomycetota bacterium]|nr:MarR family transcriptional regulator [Actinomycetota bacterium]